MVIPDSTSTSRSFVDAYSLSSEAADPARDITWSDKWTAIRDYFLHNGGSGAAGPGRRPQSQQGNVRGQENVLRPESFLLRASKVIAIGQISLPDNAALQFDWLAHMHKTGEMQGPPLVLGTASQGTDGPYCLVTNGETVWKIMVDAKAEMSWASLQDAPVKRATLAEFFAVEPKLPDESILYTRLLHCLVARQLEYDFDVSMDCIPAAYREHPIVAEAIRPYMRAKKLWTDPSAYLGPRQTWPA